jgi:xylulose-5-phosphate/fructose-6-phosphate phosphoketolase
MRVEWVDPCEATASSARKIGEILRNELAKDKDFRVFSPDETSSNKLDAIFEATDRAWLRPLKDWDKYMNPDGRVIELLSENTLFSLLVGYALTGRRGVFASYEAFLPIVSSQVDQYLKFLKQAAGVQWRKAVPALNILSTSVGWRQDHNGFSHQNPSFLSNLLMKPTRFANCLFPIDAEGARAAMEFALGAENVVNLTTFSKTDEPQWIDSNHADFQLEHGGASVFQFASDEEPQMVLAGCGDLVSKEVLFGMDLAREKLPSLRLRFVGIAALCHGAIGTTKRSLTGAKFREMFLEGVPIIAGFHGYAESLRGILENYTGGERLKVLGFLENGSTTTPLDMMVQNKISRYDVAAEIFDKARILGIIDEDKNNQLQSEMKAEIADHWKYIKEHGIDREKDMLWKIKQKR